jgi:hypothetical protein
MTNEPTETTRARAEATAIGIWALVVATSVIALFWLSFRVPSRVPTDPPGGSSVAVTQSEERTEQLSEDRRLAVSTATETESTPSNSAPWIDIEVRNASTGDGIRALIACGSHRFLGFEHVSMPAEALAKSSSVEVSAEGFRPRILSGAALLTERQVALDPTGVAILRVVDADGHSVSDAVVRPCAWRLGRPALPSDIGWRTDQRGMSEIPVGDGELVVIVHTETRMTAAPTTLSAGDDVTVELPAENSATVRFEADDPTLSDVLVRLSAYAPRPRRSVQLSIRPPMDLAMAAGTYGIEILTPGVGIETPQIEVPSRQAGEADAITVRLVSDPWATIEVSGAPPGSEWLAWIEGAEAIERPAGSQASQWVPVGTAHLRHPAAGTIEVTGLGGSAWIPEARLVLRGSKTEDLRIAVADLLAPPRLVRVDAQPARHVGITIRQGTSPRVGHVRVLEFGPDEMSDVRALWRERSEVRRLDAGRIDIRWRGGVVGIFPMTPGTLASPLAMLQPERLATEDEIVIELPGVGRAIVTTTAPLSFVLRAMDGIAEPTSVTSDQVEFADLAPGRYHLCSPDLPLGPGGLDDVPAAIPLEVRADATTQATWEEPEAPLRGGRIRRFAQRAPSTRSLGRTRVRAHRERHRRLLRDHRSGLVVAVDRVRRPPGTPDGLGTRAAHRRPAGHRRTRAGACAGDSYNRRTRFDAHRTDRHRPRTGCGTGRDEAHRIRTRAEPSRPLGDARRRLPRFDPEHGRGSNAARGTALDRERRAGSRRLATAPA